MRDLKLTKEFPVRPAHGTRGKAVSLWTNYIQLKSPKDVSLFRYDIAVTPEARGKKLTQVIRLVLETELFVGQNQNVVTDFRSTLISRIKLPIEDTTTIEVVYRKEGEDEPKKTAVKYSVRLMYTNSLSTDSLMEHLGSTDPSSQCLDKLPMIQAFNIMINHFAKQSDRLVSIGSSKMFAIGPKSTNAERCDLGQGLEAVRGFYASVRPATGRLLVNINMTHGTFVKEGALDELMNLFLNGDYGINNLKKLSSLLDKVRLRLIHLPERKNKNGDVIPHIRTSIGFARPNQGGRLERRPEVSGFGAGASNVRFLMQGRDSTSEKEVDDSKLAAKNNDKGKGKASIPEGTMISVTDFFDQAYSRRLKYPDLPVINVGSDDYPTYLPPEVCSVVPGQPVRKPLAPQQTQKMIDFAVHAPRETARSIEKQGLDATGLSPGGNPLLASFGVPPLPGLVTVSGRLLDPPRIMYKEGLYVKDGGWNLSSAKFKVPKTLGKKWACLLVARKGMQGAPNDQTFGPIIRQNFVESLGKVGMGADEPARIKKVVVSQAPYADLDSAIKDLVGENLSLILFVLHDNNADVYKCIKYLGDIKYGIHTICTLSTELRKAGVQYMANVALKFNLKLGGINHVVDGSRLNIVDQGKTMIVGIDVTHPSPGSAEGTPSIAGMVASIDKSLQQWPGVLRAQYAAREEMVLKLNEMLQTRLSLWRIKNKQYPENILVYRDGVSEGQYSLVLEKELPLLRQACKTLYPAMDQKKGLPRITIIIVGKRHNTRFFSSVKQDRAVPNTTLPGTIVDRGITEVRNWDFYLQSHKAIKGTARPAHYYVIMDEIFRPFRNQIVKPALRNVADVVEDLTQSLAYTFGRATKAIGICAPAYCADILCERARCYIQVLSNSSDSSTADSSASGSGQTKRDVTDADLEIHQLLRNSMFYI